MKFPAHPNQQLCGKYKDQLLHLKEETISCFFRYKDNQPLVSNDRIEIGEKDNVFSMRIPKCVEKADSGVYRIEFKNEFGTSETKSNVTINSEFKLLYQSIRIQLNGCFDVKVSPKFVQPLNESTNAYLAKTNELIVHILAKPIPKIKWLKDNKELIVKDRLKLETRTIEGDENLKEYKLVIENVQPNDVGKYAIEASNKCATESCQTNLVVKG